MSIHRIRSRVLPGLALALLLLAGCAPQRAEPVSETRNFLNTVCTVTVYSADDAQLLEQALAICGEYERLFSRTLEGSDIWRLNHGSGAALELDEQTVALIRLGLDYGGFSGGAFDITIGRVSALWDFGGVPAVPGPDDLAQAADTVNYRNVTVSGNTVRLLNPETWLDLGGIAKGYIADRLAEFLIENGVSAAIIDLGGNIVTVGQKPDGDPWHVGIETPFSGHRELIGRVNTGEASVVTSGVYERQFTENGVLYHHILDPKTGKPAESDVISATVVTKKSADGDALSTIFVLAGSAGADDVYERARENGLFGVVLVLQSGEIRVMGDIDFEEKT